MRFEYEHLSFLDADDLRAMLTRSYDIVLCEFLKKHLAPGDVVIDVGANVGYISAVAASYVGVAGEVHGFEPLTECYARLQRLRELNPEFRFTFNNVALGEKEGYLSLAYNPEGDSRNATLVPGKRFAEVRSVPVRRLDAYIRANISSPQRIRVIKIDVEGFEFSVLRGLEGFLEGSRVRPLIVCEIKPWELSKLGATIDDFDQFMNRFGYRPYLIPEERMPVQMSALTDMEVLVFRA